ncbi:hypothetical protein BDU57DRAFT_63792 [Ampelomyces quisqualis]|uniref:Uncharacterized protein n=1 Tax=Ampelomyces quisqualis TaxID=50730 RepID=A0A6A5R4Z9_AMPQU|nr:hypothetical protein BDU57DRAFT_63792 [Ampelomyces quisqualis]
MAGFHHEQGKQGKQGKQRRVAEPALPSWCRIGPRLSHTHHPPDTASASFALSFPLLTTPYRWCCTAALLHRCHCPSPTLQFSPCHLDCALSHTTTHALRTHCAPLRTTAHSPRPPFASRAPAHTPPHKSMLPRTRAHHHHRHHFARLFSHESS